MRRSVHIRNPWNSYDLCMDGIKPKEYLKGDLKKIYQRVNRNRLKKEFIRDISLYLGDDLMP